MRRPGSEDTLSCWSPERGGNPESACARTYVCAQECPLNGGQNSLGLLSTGTTHPFSFLRQCLSLTWNWAINCRNHVSAMLELQGHWVTGLRLSSSSSNFPDFGVFFKISYCWKIKEVISVFGMTLKKRRGGVV